MATHLDSDEKKGMDFGDYCVIEQKRYGAENEHYIYKVIGAGKANYYREVPVDGAAPFPVRGKMCDVVKCICAGVCEEKVETFRMEDVKQKNKFSDNMRRG